MEGTLRFNLNEPQDEMLYKQCIHFKEAYAVLAHMHEYLQMQKENNLVDIEEVLKYYINQLNTHEINLNNIIYV